MKVEEKRSEEKEIVPRVDCAQWSVAASPVTGHCGGGGGGGRILINSEFMK